MSGQTVHGIRKTESYRLEGFWLLNLLDGEGEVTIDGRTFPFKPGYAAILWPGVDLNYRFRGRTTNTWAHFVPAKNAELVDMPVVQDLGADFNQVRKNIQIAASLFRDQRSRAMSYLWEVLWQLVPTSVQTPIPENHPHPIIDKALDEIDIHLARNIPAWEVARNIGTSQTHLNRLFTEKFGTTIGNYMRERRLEVAVHMLTHTAIPIKEIAYHVGISNLQRFNKLIRRHKGQSPRNLRTSMYSK